MAYDVKIWEGGSWEFIGLLRIEESESNTSAAWDIVHLPSNIPGQSDQPRETRSLAKGDRIVVFRENCIC